MRCFISILMLFFAKGICFAQQPALLVDTNYRRPFLLIDGKQADPLSLMVLDEENIKTLVVLSPAQAVKYGKKNSRFGAVEITTVNPKDILNFSELITQFHFKKEAAKLPFFVHFGLYYAFLSPREPKLFVASLSMLASLKSGKGVEKEFFKLTLSKRWFGIPPHPKNVQLDSLVQSLIIEAKRRAPIGYR